jgi:hypothetical protein
MDKCDTEMFLGFVVEGCDMQMSYYRQHSSGFAPSTWRLG